MASILGVSSLYQLSSLEISKRVTSTSLLKFVSDSSSSTTTTPFLSLISRSCRQSHRRSLLFIPPPSAIATPNSVLSEEAFKSLGGGGGGALLNVDGKQNPLYGQVDDDDSQEEEEEGDEQTKDNDLALVTLDLPQPLVESLEKRGITHLFPIQVTR